mmetsp:Transcript_55776/g.122158  ORF Transcript_55776/g.122158 Transcript_55776/m.122158 type:complete len:230 (-) Transcript_55776:1445-2134(-)
MDGKVSLIDCTAIGQNPLTARLTSFEGSDRLMYIVANRLHRWFMVRGHSHFRKSFLLPRIFSIALCTKLTVFTRQRSSSLVMPASNPLISTLGVPSENHPTTVFAARPAGALMSSSVSAAPDSTAGSTSGTKGPKSSFSRSEHASKTSKAPARSKGLTSDFKHVATARAITSSRRSGSFRRQSARDRAAPCLSLMSSDFKHPNNQGPNSASKMSVMYVARFPTAVAASH